MDDAIHASGIRPWYHLLCRPCHMGEHHQFTHDADYDLEEQDPRIGKMWYASQYASSLTVVPVDCLQYLHRHGGLFGDLLGSPVHASHTRSQSRRGCHPARPAGVGWALHQPNCGFHHANRQRHMDPGGLCIPPSRQRSPTGVSTPRKQLLDIRVSGSDFQHSVLGLGSWCCIC